jgi:hypothetical protein
MFAFCLFLFGVGIGFLLSKARRYLEAKIGKSFNDDDTHHA